jgi:hypothetical protein
MSRFIAELLPLGHDQFLASGREPDVHASDVIVLPAERARQVLRAAFRQDRDVRARLLALHLRLDGSALQPSGVAVGERDFQRALGWALAMLRLGPAPGSVRLHVLQRVRPRIEGFFVPIGLPPAKPPPEVVEDPLSSLEFEVLDQHGDPLGGVPYVVTFPDGEVRRGRLSTAGYAFISSIPPGSYDIAFPAAEQPEEEEEADFLDIELVTTEGEPLGGFAYVATFSDGSKWEGVLDENGRAHLAPVPPGDFEVRFPALDAEPEDAGDGEDEALEDDDGNDNALEPDDGSPPLVADERVDDAEGAAIHDDHDAGDDYTAPSVTQANRSCAPPPRSNGASGEPDSVKDALDELLP